MKKLILSIAAIATIAPAIAQHHDGGGFHGGGEHRGGEWHGGERHGDRDHWRGGIWIGPGYGYDPYYPLYGYVPPPVYVEPPSLLPPRQEAWYWCPTYQQYYPNVQTCNVPWQQVLR